MTIFMSLQCHIVTVEKSNQFNETSRSSREPTEYKPTNPNKTFLGFQVWHQIHLTSYSQEKITRFELGRQYLIILIVFYCFNINLLLRWDETSSQKWTFFNSCNMTKRAFYLLSNKNLTSSPQTWITSTSPHSFLTWALRFLASEICTLWSRMISWVPRSSSGLRIVFGFFWQNKNRSIEYIMNNLSKNTIVRLDINKTLSNDVCKK